MDGLLQRVRPAVRNSHRGPHAHLPVAELLLGDGEGGLHGGEQDALVVLVAVGEGAERVHGGEALAAEELVEALEEQVLADELGAVGGRGGRGGAQLVRRLVLAQRAVGVGAGEAAGRGRAGAGAGAQAEGRGGARADEQVGLDGVLLGEHDVGHAHALDLLLQVAHLNCCWWNVYFE